MVCIVINVMLKVHRSPTIKNMQLLQIRNTYETEMSRVSGQSQNVTDIMYSSIITCTLIKSPRRK